MAAYGLTEKDFRRAKLVLEEERIYPVTYENMFCAGIYCILSAAEKYEKFRQVYQKVLRHELNTPDKIMNKREELKKVLSTIRFPNEKEDRVYNFAVWWKKSFMPETILKDINLGRKEEFVLRNRLAEECPGLSYKGASLFMVKCGYENVVPIDLWVLRFLKQLGYEVAVPDYRQRSGPKQKEYVEYERILTEIASECKVSPAQLQAAIWAKLSNWGLQTSLESFV
jgi:thermostable 8-oxoguanine DNA glycosylase